MPSPYRQLLGIELDRLPSTLRAFHDVETSWRGEALFRVVRGDGWVRNLVAWLGGLPHSGEKVPVILTCTGAVRGGRRVEQWDRDFNGFRMRSTQWVWRGLLVESFGWLTLGYRLHVEPPGLRLEVSRAWVAGIPFPLFLAPTGEGLEVGDAHGMNIRVSAFAPMLGLIVRYEGRLNQE